MRANLAHAVRRGAPFGEPAQIARYRGIRVGGSEEAKGEFFTLYQREHMLEKVGFIRKYGKMSFGNTCAAR